MKSVRMRHAAPLTPFQESLYDVVLNAFNRKIEPLAIRSNNDLIDFQKQNPQTCFCLEKPEVNKNNCQEITTENRSKDVLEIMLGVIEDNIKWIFPIIAVCNILWLQIMIVNVIQNKSLLIFATVLKYLMISGTAVFYVIWICTCFKNTWKRLKEWSEESLEEECR